MKKSPYKSISKILDPAGIFKKHKVKPIISKGEASAFKMKGYSYPGISPLKDIKPTEHIRTESKKPPYFEDKKEYEIIDDQIVYTSPNVDKHTGEDLPKVSSKSKVKKPTVVERLASSKLGKNIKGLAEGPVGEAVIASLATRALSRKEKEEPTRIISGDWKIM